MNPEFATEMLKTLMLQAVDPGHADSRHRHGRGPGHQLVSIRHVHPGTNPGLCAQGPGIVGLLIVLMPWMLRRLIEFTTAMIEKMPQMVR